MRFCCTLFIRRPCSDSCHVMVPYKLTCCYYNYCQLTVLWWCSVEWLVMEISHYLLLSRRTWSTSSLCKILIQTKTVCRPYFANCASVFTSTAYICSHVNSGKVSKSLHRKTFGDFYSRIFMAGYRFAFWWAEPGGIGPWPGWLTVVLQCYDTVGWIIWP